MNVVDTSGWIEFLADGPQRAEFAAPLTDIKRLLVPTICIYEVFKWMLRERSAEKAKESAEAMLSAEVMDLDGRNATRAAKIALEYDLSVADGIIYAAAAERKADLWTMDSDFQGLPRVHYIAKKGRVE